MRNILIACLSILLSATLWLPGKMTTAYAADPPEWTRYPLIAHALGGIDGIDYTNSLQAFTQNYDKGQRVFEIDLSLTEDGKLAARHDWMGYLAQKFEQDIPENKLDEPLTLKEFKSYKILEKYTPLSFNDVVRILNKHPDVYFITDTKETDPKLVKQQFTLIRDTANKVDPAILDRVIPEIYSPEMMETVKEIVPFKNVIFSIYLSAMEPDEVVNFVKNNGIRVVAMPTERVTDGFIAALTKAGVVTYAHSINDTAEVKQLMDLGVHGVYTDFLTYADLGINPTPLHSAALADANADIKSQDSKLNASILQPAVTAAVITEPLANGQTIAQAPQKSAWETLKSLWTELISTIL
ncbi:phosphatidylinositol-specific phospholipase C/glycerophosphodiester phosphodiesterase family protein [Paenibacillus radicis (ex Xue et al. 2023)]|uniref:GP-PDE domain-containing protein n=1 Tax=Paenibacillus radicis (ex Xue et al. 2023) TaxID=2972489 RepID=A0ABT1YLW9_9BACL|nr:phosphatidylinositol-specific phospholipase C/glycerophosphodiester phosphodiesterase family protein [Paenibacillus radicis (ex Xue et al. 2023)]MCR8634017.1 hypothetical protein [Paenibacillus radicis (ex Xue et al. 2023)]